MTAPATINPQLGLGLNIPDPPLLALLRELCAGSPPTDAYPDGVHPCPDGVTVHYLTRASGDTPDEVYRELRRLWQARRVVRTEIDDDYYGALWRPL